MFVLPYINLKSLRQYFKKGVLPEFVRGMELVWYGTPENQNQKLRNIQSIY